MSIDGAFIAKEDGFTDANYGRTQAAEVDATGATRTVDAPFNVETKEVVRKAGRMLTKVAARETNSAALISKSR